MNIEMNKREKDLSTMEYFTKIPRYGWRNGLDEEWENYLSKLDCDEWNDISKGMNVEQKLEDIYRILSVIARKYDDH